MSRTENVAERFTQSAAYKNANVLKEIGDAASTFKVILEDYVQRASATSGAEFKVGMETDACGDVNVFCYNAKASKRSGYFWNKKDHHAAFSVGFKSFKRMPHNRGSLGACFYTYPNSGADICEYVVPLNVDAKEKPALDISSSGRGWGDLPKSLTDIGDAKAAALKWFEKQMELMPYKRFIDELRNENAPKTVFAQHYTAT